GLRTANYLGEKSLVESDGMVCLGAFRLPDPRRVPQVRYLDEALADRGGASAVWRRSFFASLLRADNWSLDRVSSFAHGVFLAEFVCIYRCKPFSRERAHVWRDRQRLVRAQFSQSISGKGTARRRVGGPSGASPFANAQVSIAPSFSL